MKIDKVITVGFEQETVSITRNARLVCNSNRFILTRDKTVKNDDGTPIGSGDTEGGHEIIAPFVRVHVKCGQDGSNFEADTSELERVLTTITSCCERVNTSCGFHVHYGRPRSDDDPRSRWDPEKVRTWLALGLSVEDAIFTACHESRLSSNHCRKLRSLYPPRDIASYYPVEEGKAWKYDNKKRYAWLNLTETRRNAPDVPVDIFRNTASGSTGTVEIRALGNTKSVPYMLAWATMWLKVATCVAYVPSSLTILRYAHGGLLMEDLNRIISLRDAQPAVAVA
jgi:hypothetical protein